MRSVSAPRLKPAWGIGGEANGKDLNEEFETLGAEAQLMPGLGKDSCRPKPSIPLKEPTCREDINMQRLSECGVGGEESLVSTSSLVWWYQPEGWAPTICLVLRFTVRAANVMFESDQPS